MAGLISVFRNRGLMTLMLGHLTVDSYVGLLPVLYPLLIQRFSLNLATVGLVSLAYSGMAAVSQPLFGVLADRVGTRFTGAAVIWTVVTFAAIGFAPNFPTLVGVAALSGLGSGAFHPFGAVTVRGLLPERGANLAMSVYVTGGTLGVAVGPLIGVVLFTLLGVRGTALLLVPGLASAGFVLFAMRRPEPRSRPAAAGGGARVLAVAPLVAVIAVMASRSWTLTTLQAFTPTWYHRLGYSPWFYGSLATTIVLSSAIGTVGTGSLADRWGRKAVILGSLLLSIPAVGLFVAFPGSLGFLWAIGIGALAGSTAPLCLMLAQELMRGRTGLASGLVMGLGFVTGAIGVPITGIVADRWGLQSALMLQVAVVLATIPIALALPGEPLLRRLHEPTGGAPRAAAAGATGE